MEYKYDIEKLLNDNNIIQIEPQGYSMYPLFIPGRDKAILEKVDFNTLHTNDIILYRRDQGILVLHRICKITSSGYYLVGDNQYEIEGPLRKNQIFGHCIGFIRNGKEISTQNILYRTITRLWLILLPVRKYCFSFTRLVRRLFQSK